MFKSFLYIKIWPTRADWKPAETLWQGIQTFIFLPGESLGIKTLKQKLIFFNVSL